MHCHVLPCIKIQRHIEGEQIILYYKNWKFDGHRKLQHQQKGYILLATIQSEPMLRNDPTTLTQDNILIAKKYLRNQTQSSKKDYHFGTTGHIYGFGFGSFYASNNETKYTIDRFAKSKCISIHFLFI